MLGVGLRKLCPQDSFGYAFREKKAVRKSTPEGCKIGPLGVQMASGRSPDGSSVPAAAKAARNPCSNGPGGALGTLVALLQPSWGPPGASRAAPGRLLGVLLRPPKG